MSQWLYSAANVETELSGVLENSPNRGSSSTSYLLDKKSSFGVVFKGLVCVCIFLSL